MNDSKFRRKVKEYFTEYQQSLASTQFNETDKIVEKFMKWIGSEVDR